MSMSQPPQPPQLNASDPLPPVPGAGNSAQNASDGQTAPGPQAGRAARAVPILLNLCLVLFAAHCYRAGYTGLAAASLLWGCAILSRSAWMQPVSVLVLLGLSAEWFVTCGRILQIRLFMDEPWLRLVIILCAVAGINQLAALLVLRAGSGWFDKRYDLRHRQLAAFGLALLLLLPVLVRAPHLLLFERLVPGTGALQVLLAALWAALVCDWLSDRKRAHARRLLVWRLFSVVFFGQFLLSAAGYALFSLTGSLHIPVPGVIVGGALYRGEPGFMLLLFLATVLLAGPAWCSHLCYLGSWDAAAADSSGADSRAHRLRLQHLRERHPLALHPLFFRLIMLGLTVLCALLLKALGAPLPLVLGLGVASGLLLLPAALLLSRRYGQAGYCTLVCPLGLLACLAGRLSPWRLAIDRKACTQCGTCTRVCRYAALTGQTVRQGAPGLSCVLCRDCLQACPHQAIALTLAGRQGKTGARTKAVDGAFVSLVSALHAVFLFLAMV